MSRSSGPPVHGGLTRVRCSAARNARFSSAGRPSYGEVCERCSAIAASRAEKWAELSITVVN